MQLGWETQLALCHPSSLLLLGPCFSQRYLGGFSLNRPLGRFSHRVAMSVCLSVCLSVRHTQPAKSVALCLFRRDEGLVENIRVLYISIFLIMLQVTTFLGMSNTDNQSSYLGRCQEALKLFDYNH